MAKSLSRSVEEVGGEVDDEEYIGETGVGDAEAAADDEDEADGGDNVALISSHSTFSTKSQGFD